MIAHKSPISGVATFGGRLVATAGYDNQIIMWDARLQRPLSRALHDHLVNQVAFSSDGLHLVSSSSDHTARVWSVPDLKLIAVLSEHDDDVEMAEFHPTSNYIATASRDNCVRVFDFGGRMIQRFEGHSADVISVAWSPKDDEVISSSDDGTIKRWSLTSGRLVADIDLRGIETDTIAISSSGVVFAGDDEGKITIIAPDETKVRLAHRAGIKRLVYHSKDELLVSLSYDRTLRIWSTLRNDLIPIAIATFPAEIWPRSCAFIDSDRLAFATFGSSYATYDRGTNAWNLERVGPTIGINAVVVINGQRLTIGDAGILRVNGEPSIELGSLCNFLTPALPRVLTGGQSGGLYDALTGELLFQHRSPLNCGATYIHGRSTFAIIGTYTGDGLLFELGDDGKIDLIRIIPLHLNAVKSIAISNGIIFSVCADTAVSWFSIQDFSEIARQSFAHERIANGCAALNDGRFVSVSRDHKLRLWGTTLISVISTPHKHSIKCVATEGKYIATASYFGVVAVFDLQNSVWSNVERPTASGISSLCFDRYNGCFLAASYDGNVYEISV